jgi:hypothetical protein
VSEKNCEKALSDVLAQVSETRRSSLKTLFAGAGAILALPLLASYSSVAYGKMGGMKDERQKRKKRAAQG